MSIRRSGVRGGNKPTSKKSIRKTSPIPPIPHKSYNDKVFPAHLISPDHEKVRSNQSHVRMGDMMPLTQMLIEYDLDTVVNTPHLLKSLNPLDYQDLAQKSFDDGYFTEVVQSGDMDSFEHYDSYDIEELVMEEFGEDELEGLDDEAREDKIQELWEQYIEGEYAEPVGKTSVIFDNSITIPIDFIMYHGTSIDTAKQIISSHSLGRTDSWSSRDRIIYLADESSVAGNYGEVVFRIKGIGLQQDQIYIDPDPFGKFTTYGNEQSDNQYISEPISTKMGVDVLIHHNNTTRDWSKIARENKDGYYELTLDQFTLLTSN